MATQKKLQTGLIRVKKTANGSWVDLPVPKYGGLKIEIQTNVNEARDATATFNGETIGQDKIKLNIDYPPLDDDEARKVLSFFDRERGGVFKCYVNFYDPRIGGRTTRYMYVGNRSLEPWKCPVANNGKPEKWLNLQCNLIEV